MRARTVRVGLLMLVGLLLGTLLGALVGLLGGPRSPALGTATTGDPALAADVRAALTTDRGYLSLSAARIRDGQVTFAGVGAVDGAPPTADTSYELGSITKTFTASLLSDAVRRGEVGLDDPVSTHFDELAGTPVGDATLRQLATHTAGLPPFPSSATPGVLLRVVGNTNPYPGTVAGMLDAARTTKVTDRGTYRYSNLGVALLGHALARAAGSPSWTALVQTRIFEAVGMPSTQIVDRVVQVPEGVAHPHHDNGWPAPFWTGPAFAPAGSSTITTARDLATWARALLDGTAPGASAMDPVLDVPGGRIGLVWQTDDVDGRAITWHNGGTGGTRTILALDRARGQAVLLLSNTTRDADTAGLRLAAIAPGQPVPAVDSPSIGWAGLLGWSLLGFAMLVTTAFRWRGGRGWPLVDGTLAAATGLIVLLVHGPWQLLPFALWFGVAGAMLALGVTAVRRTVPVKQPSRASTVGSLLSTALVLALVIWTL